MWGYSTRVVTHFTADAIAEVGGPNANRTAPPRQFRTGHFHGISSRASSSAGELLRRRSHNDPRRMSYSLQSRDLIADSIETVMGAQWYDAMVAMPGCDKNMPGCVMAMARLNLPGAHGLRRHDPAPATRERQALDIVSAFQSLRRVPRRQDHRRSSGSTSCSTRVPGRRLRRHVHGQHDGDRPSRRWACRCRTARRCPPAIPAKVEECHRAGAAVAAARAGNQAARHHDARRRSRMRWPW